VRIRLNKVRPYNGSLARRASPKKRPLMAKRKHQERSRVKPVEQTPVLTRTTEPSTETEKKVPPAEELGDLAQEVESFLSQRTELHGKLLHEIEATEKKLAELKRAASLLVPEEKANTPANKGRNLRKAKQGRAKRSVQLKPDAEAKFESVSETLETPKSEAASG